MERRQPVSSTPSTLPKEHSTIQRWLSKRLSFQMNLLFLSATNQTISHEYNDEARSLGVPKEENHPRTYWSDSVTELDNFLVILDREQNQET
ncbi:hypothetical protein MJO28_016103 [Puccinia striiformis f. sp. tritici]|uniref:Uncharacterized protein n=1 Tax=Puccinia striiformis f. sp. tritici TaxID=168172 RepID=A0ACC0DTH2_9BASI|nr:hypothetical protein MJO29_015289 [Puccinia striiformis f. sp. tritici]KAI7937204.1 hypothetical protein MJO28_016103 [Puccinia striiformis f. sp. tritici]